ncbi:MAG: extracellular solute-binding protein [Clostridia bacterium]|nr:extracellular solute-binding protein [Clostridia bacterium]
MKKPFIVFTAALLAASIALPLAGCAGINLDNAVIDLDVDVTQNRPTLKGLYPNSGMSDDLFQNSITAKQLEKITGYKVSYSQITSGNEEQAVGTALLDPDTYSFVKCGRGSFDQYVVNDAFLDLTDALKTYAPDLLEVIDDDLWEACTYNGKIYAIPEYGFGYMQDNALIFNKKHLEAVGITKVPETLTEFTDAVHALQDKYGANPNYNAFAMAGSDAELSIISSTFEMPCEFYEDEDGQVKNYIFSEKTKNYYQYMNEEIFMKNCIPASWTTAQADKVMAWFVNEEISVAHLPYWYVQSLCDSMAATNSAYADSAAAREAIVWQTRIKGDGSYGSIVQEKGRMRGIGDVGYMIAIPEQSVDVAPYALDWMNTKITDENYKAFLLGEEGVSYEIIDAANVQEGDIGIEEDDGSTTYYRLLEKYAEVQQNSMYTTGGNPAMGRKYWPLREASYDCWPILLPVEEDDLMITSVIAKCPCLPEWSGNSIRARSTIITGAQQMINATNKNDRTSLETILTNLQKSFNDKYWTKSCAEQVQTWYDASRRNG